MSQAPTQELTEEELAELEKIGFEPDNVPSRLLVGLAVGLTISVVVFVILADVIFKSTVAAELEAKGYTVESQAVMERPAE